MAPSCTAGRPVTCPSTVTGAPKAPNATGAVLKIRVKVKASSGGNPTRISSALVIATGVPKPEMPSSRQPKQNPMTTSTIRRSFGKWSSTQSRNASKRPEATAMLYNSNALNTIHITGHSECDDQSAQRSLPCGPAQHPQHDQHDGDRRHGNQKRDRQTAGNRRQQLMEHVSLRLSVSARYESCSAGARSPGRGRRRRVQVLRREVLHRHVEP